jgi:hypothetical protein
MKKLHLKQLFLMLCLCLMSCNSEEEIHDKPLVLDTDIYLLGDEEYAEFTALGVSEVTGDLHIDLTTVTDLSDLKDLIKVGGDFHIGTNRKLTSLIGLEQLQSIDGTFYINGENAIEHLSGLDALLTIGGDFVIRSAKVLKSMEGFGALNHIGGSMSINNNSHLESLANFKSLTTIGGNLIFYRNSKLISIDGLETLTTIGGAFKCNWNAVLTSLNGLENLKTVAGLEITNNAQLTNFCDLQGIEVTWATIIDSNAYNPSLEVLHTNACEALH